MATPGPSTAIQSGKDPRQLRDKHVQSKMKQDIVAYLQAMGFEVTTGTIAKLPAKEYRMIFTWLVTKLDPTFPFNEDMRFEDEIKIVLRGIRYPYMNGFDAKWVTAPGAMHASAPLLGLLHWLVDMCQVRAYVMIFAVAVFDYAFVAIC
jgi:kinetochore protein NDC80